MGADAYVTKANTTPKQAIELVAKMLDIPSSSQESDMTHSFEETDLKLA